MDLEGLLRAARDGEPRAWAKLIPPLVRKLRRYFERDFEEADALDLTQQTVTNVVVQLPGFVARESLEGWVFGIARNLARREYRSRGRDRAIAELAADIVPKPVTSPTAQVLEDQRSAVFYEELAKLPPHYRAVVEHDLGGGDLESFAKQHGLNPSTARSHRHRAYKRLRRQIAARLQVSRVPAASARATPPTPT